MRADPDASADGVPDGPPARGWPDVVAQPANTAVATTVVAANAVAVRNIPTACHPAVPAVRPASTLGEASDNGRRLAWDPAVSQTSRTS